LPVAVLVFTNTKRMCACCRTTPGAGSATSHAHQRSTHSPSSTPEPPYFIAVRLSRTLYTTCHEFDGGSGNNTRASPGLHLLVEFEAPSKLLGDVFEDLFQGHLTSALLCSHSVDIKRPHPRLTVSNSSEQEEHTLLHKNLKQRIKAKMISAFRFTRRVP
jgi:hypothetical protein